MTHYKRAGGVQTGHRWRISAVFFRSVRQSRHFLIPAVPAMASSLRRNPFTSRIINRIFDFYLFEVFINRIIVFITSYAPVITAAVPIFVLK